MRKKQEVKDNKRKLSSAERAVVILSVVICAAIVLLAILQIFEVWDASPVLILPLLMADMLLQAYVQRNNGRVVVIFSLCAAAVMFVCSVTALVLYLAP